VHLFYVWFLFEGTHYEPAEPRSFGRHERFDKTVLIKTVCHKHLFYVDFKFCTVFRNCVQIGMYQVYVSKKKRKLFLSRVLNLKTVIKRMKENVSEKSMFLKSQEFE
jgi:hypothetical protein